MSVWLLALAWGLVAAAPLARRARRRRVAVRATWLRIEPATSPAERPSLAARVASRLPLGAPGRVARALISRRRASRDDALLAAELPVALDLLGVAVGAGCTPYLAVEVATRWAPPANGARLGSAPRACALGASFVEALDDVAMTTPRLRPLVDALLASDRLGAPVAPARARLAEEERTELRRRAETDARRVPVRLLFPLVFLVLPAFGLLTVVPTLVGGLTRT